MKRKLFRIAIALTTLIIIASFVMVLYSLNKSSETNNTGNGVISLEAPLFTSVAEASPAQDTKTFLEGEAGVSAYTNVGQVDLTVVKEIYRAIEREEDGYLVGVVDIPDYDDTQAPHVYASEDGWVVAYYLKDDPASKIMDWVSYENTGTVGTKLEIALRLTCDSIGKIMSDVKYYDFRYPEANSLMVIADKDGEFKVKIPDDITVYERSIWNYRAGGKGWISIYIDGKELEKAPEYRGTWRFSGKLTPIQLSQGVFHTITTTAGASLGSAFVYKEP